MKEVRFQAIGEIRTPFKTIEDMPIQPAGAHNIDGKVIVQESFAEGLDDVDGFSHLILI
jgi:tRNA (Thr-GGU) A37 N-methylase